MTNAAAVIAEYAKYLEDKPESIGVMADFRHRAIEKMRALGFPTRKNESWKYTPLPVLTATAFLPAASCGESATAAQLIDGSQNEDVYTLSICDGVIQSNTSELPSFLSVRPIVDALCDDEKLRNTIDEAVSCDQFFSQLNMAFLSAGFVITLEENRILDKPLRLRHIGQLAQHSFHTHNVLILGANSQCQLIEEFQAGAQHAYFTNAMVSCVLAQKANLSHCKIVCESEQAQHIALTQVYLNEGAAYQHLDLTLSGALIRNDIVVSFTGENAQAQLMALSLANKSQHIDNHTQLLHHAPSCQSTQLYKNIVSDNARCVFNGRVRVGRDADKTNSSQMNKNILLSATSMVDTKPELEIYADDVKCAHGATVGQLDDEALFFLRTRGLCAEQASILLMEAFAKEVLDALSISAIKPVLQAKMMDKLNQLSLKENR